MIQIVIGLSIINIAVSFEGSMEFLPEIFEAQVQIENKVAAFLLDFLHNVFTGLSLMLPFLILIQIIFFGELNVYVLLILYGLYLLMIALFFSFKMCILTIIYNKLLKIHKCAPYIYPYNRLWEVRNEQMSSGVLDKYGDGCEVNTQKWMKHHAKIAMGLSIFTVLILGIKFFTKVKTI